MEYKVVRQSIPIRETDSSGMLRFLYNNICGRVLLKLLTRPFVSKIVGWFMDSRFSSFLINRFIRKTELNMCDFEDKNFRSYNDLFTRQIAAGKRNIDYDPGHLICPCDSKLSVYNINDDALFSIKNSNYTLEDLLDNKSLAGEYAGGYCLIFRLTVDDYHRYCYVDNGTKGENTYIHGELHTVQPIALRKYNIYKRNCREYTIMNTENFGQVVQVEVGAMMIGRIKNHHVYHAFKRGEEKGVFEFGGSTIVLLFKNDAVTIDADLINNSNNNMETVVKFGEKIGEAVKVNTKTENIYEKANI